MQRPTGVAILAGLLIVIGILGVLGGVSYLSLTQMATAEPVAGLPPTTLGWLNIAVGAIALVVGWGLWALKPWAWLLAIVVTVVRLFFEVVKLFNPNLMLAGGLGIVISAAIIWYLLRPEVRRAFRRAG